MYRIDLVFIFLKFLDCHGIFLGSQWVISQFCGSSRGGGGGGGVEEGDPDSPGTGFGMWTYVTENTLNLLAALYLHEWHDQMSI